MSVSDPGSSAAALLAAALKERQVRVVFAESCTAGLVAARLAHTPGVSAYHCGSAVTYRERTKIDWLGVSAEDIARLTAVSAPVARQMAVGVLSMTVEADWSAAITGHLGPDAPEGLDGVVFIACAQRHAADILADEPARIVLSSPDRLSRQSEAADLVLRMLREAIERDHT